MSTCEHENRPLPALNYGRVWVCPLCSAWFKGACDAWLGFPVWEQLCGPALWWARRRVGRAAR